MTTITIKDISAISDDNLQELFAQCQLEIMNRRRAHREKLIEDFLNAWQALQDNGVDVAYCDDTMEYDIRLDQYDGFDFI